MDDLYNRIDAMAKERGYKNMTALCNAAGIPRATMTELKKGRSKSLLPETARKLANVLNVSLDDIFGITDKQEEQPAAQGDGPMIPQEFKARYWALSKRSRDELDRYAQYLLAREADLQDSADSQKKASDK